MLQAFGFIYAAFVTTRLKATPSVSRDDRPGVWQSLVEGLRYIGASPALRGLLSLAAVPTLLAMPYVQLLPAFARNELGTDATGLGVLMAAVGVGAVAGALGVAAAGEIQRRGVLLLGAACGLGLSLVLFSLSTNFWIALALLPLVGVFGSIYMSINTTLLLAHVKDEYRGRVMSVYMLTWGLMPLGVLPEGALAQAIGVRPTLAIAGAVCSLFVVAVGLRSPTLRALR
ncbi:MAG: MFS transporter [Chloroflexia bacterium]